MHRLPLVAALAALALGSAAPASAAPVSSHAMVYACCSSAAEKERFFAEAAASGAEFIRVDVELDATFPEPPGAASPDWRGLDALLELAARHDLKLLGVLLRTPSWLSSCPARGQDSPLCPPRDPGEFGRLAAEVAAHAGPAVEYWQILNEPDARWAFKGGAQDYARVLAASHDAIAERVPAARIVLGGLERPGERRWLDAMLATPGADAARKFDVAAAHLRVRQGEELSDLSRSLTAFRARLSVAGFAGPTWVTEHGYPADPAFQRDPAYGGGEAGQAAFYRDSLDLLAAAGAEQIFVTLRDNLFGEYLSEGLVSIGGPPEHPAERRPAFDTVRDLARDSYVLIADDARRREHARLSVRLAAAARRSRSAGRSLAAALQEGAALGHARLARRPAQPVRP